MRIEQTTILTYISMDGVSFETEEACIEHERAWFNENFTGVILDGNLGNEIDYREIPNLGIYFYIPGDSDLDTLETLYNEYSSMGREAPSSIGVYQYNEDITDYVSLEIEVGTLTVTFNALGLDIHDYIPDIPDETPEPEPEP